MVDTFIIRKKIIFLIKGEYKDKIMKIFIWVVSIILGALLITLIKPGAMLSTIIAVIATTIPAIITKNISIIVE